MLRAKTSEKIIVSPFSEVVAVDTDDVALAHAVLADTSGTVWAIYTNGACKRIFNNNTLSPFTLIWLT